MHRGLEAGKQFVVLGADLFGRKVGKFDALEIPHAKSTEICGKEIQPTTGVAPALLQHGANVPFALQVPHGGANRVPRRK